jgi:hypothetical protein
MNIILFDDLCVNLKKKNDGKEMKGIYLFECKFNT